MLLRLGRVPGVPGVLAQLGVRNTGKHPFNLLELRPFVLAGQLAGSPEEWLITPLSDGYQNLAALGNITAPMPVWEYGALYRPDGAGFLFGPVGTPIAYLRTLISHGGTGNVKVTVSSRMSGAEVSPGDMRWGQQVVLLMEKPLPAMTRWTEWVAKTHGARTSQGALSGWSRCLLLGGEVTGKDVLKVAETVLRSGERLRPDVIQIDQGYEDPAGVMETNEKFPEGLAFYAQFIAAAGARPGLHVGFRVTPDDQTWMNTANWTNHARSIRNAVLNGFTYLKIDAYDVEVRAWADRKKTDFEAVREGFGALREAAGDQTYLMYCNSSANRATVGLVDASRIGIIADRDAVRDAMDSVLRSFQLHDRWFAVDNCSYYMGTDNVNLSSVAGGWPMVRTWMSMVGMSCGAAFTCDPWYWENFKPYWRNVEVMTPPARERTEVLDLLAKPEWPRLVGHVNRDWGDWTVALLWNPRANTESAITLDFAAAGLDPQRRYAVWSFWDNRYLSVAKGSWTTPEMAP